MIIAIGLVGTLVVLSGWFRVEAGGRSGLAAGLIVLVGGIGAWACMRLAFSQEGADLDELRSRLIAQLMLDSRSNAAGTVAGTDDAVAADLRSMTATPAELASTAVPADVALLTDVDAKIAESVENQRWALGGAGAATVFAVGGLGQLIALVRVHRNKSPVRTSTNAPAGASSGVAERQER
ncbi:MAG: hypothetical protein ABI140_06730 [Jatrophihabitantaceae bacterium]